MHIRFAKALALAVASLPCTVLAQTAPKAEQSALAGPGNCARLGADIPALAATITVDTTDKNWHRQVSEWLIDLIARGLADQLLSGEKSSGQKASDYVSAYKGALDAAELHQAEIDQRIVQTEPRIHDEISNALCALLSAEDIRSIARFMATPAGQNYRMIRLSPDLRPERLPAFLAMTRSIAEASRGW